MYRPRFIRALRVRLLLRAALLLAIASPSALADPPKTPWWKRMFVLPYAKVEKLVLKPPAAVQAKVSFEALGAEIPGRIARVPEFAWIRGWAEKAGVKVYLFGGTASAYAHYVHGDLLREAGDTRYQAAHFDYDYTNVFRSTQDLDIVVDGPPETAVKLQNELSERFKYLQGQKSQWEVRLLRSSIGDKEALLDNPNFLNQHTDSHSTALVEITRSSDPPVRDLRDWNSGIRNQFLRDVHGFNLHYYWSRLHGKTARASKGLNPPIISVVRALTKAFQYELELDEESVSYLTKEIKAFKASRIGDQQYVMGWLNKNAPKLIQNAVNIEYAVETLNTLGLLEKLASLGDPNQVDSMAWWLRKKPLSTKAVGAGNGKTAAQLGIDVVAHETNSFLAYESITKAHTGDPNVLSSRTDIAGEMAAYGEGFYTRKGIVGARGTGITIRFRVDPNARLGHDFEIAGDFVIFKNKAAFKVIPESLNLTPLELVERVEAGLVTVDAKIDLALLEKFKRRIRPRIALATGEERVQIVSRFRAQLAKEVPDREALQLYIDLFGADPNFPEIWKDLREKAMNGGQPLAITDPWLLWLREARRKTELGGGVPLEVRRAFEREVDALHDRSVQKILGNEFDFSGALRAAVAKKGGFWRKGAAGLAMPLHLDIIWNEAKDHAEDPLVMLYLAEVHSREFFTHALALAHWMEHPASVSIFLSSFEVLRRADMWDTEFLHGIGGWGKHPKALAMLDYFFDHYLKMKYSAQKLKEFADGKDYGGFLRGLKSDLDYWMLARRREYVGSGEFRKPATWLDHPELLKICPGGVNAKCLLEYHFSGKRFSPEPLVPPCEELFQKAH